MQEKDKIQTRHRQRIQHETSGDSFADCSYWTTKEPKNVPPSRVSFDLHSTGRNSTCVARLEKYFSSIFLAVSRILEKKKHRQNMFLLRLLMVLLAGNSVHPGAMRFSLLSRYVNVCLPTLLITSSLNFVKKCLNPHTVENCVHCILQRASELFVISLWAWSKPFKFNWQTSVNSGWFEQRMIWKLTVLLSRNPEHTEINHLDH